MNILLEDFIKFTTYQGLFGSVSLVNHPQIAQAILADDPEMKRCHLEYVQTDHYILWTFNGWIAECKRRMEVEQLMKDTVKQVSKKLNVETPDDLRDQLVQAMLDDKQDLAEELMNKIKQLKGTAV